MSETGGMALGRILVSVGLVLVAAGLLVMSLGSYTALGRLPGDFTWRRGTFTFHFPLMTSLLLSLLLSAMLWLFGRR